MRILYIYGALRHAVGNISGSRTVPKRYLQLMQLGMRAEGWLMGNGTGRAKVASLEW